MAKRPFQIAEQGFQNNPAPAGVPAGGTKFTAGYFVQFLNYQSCSPSSTLSFQTKLFFLNLVNFIAWLFSKMTYYFVKLI
jgi:hypothetical protein